MSQQAQVQESLSEIHASLQAQSEAEQLRSEASEKALQQLKQRILEREADLARERKLSLEDRSQFAQALLTERQASERLQSALQAQLDQERTATALERAEAAGAIEALREKSRLAGENLARERALATKKAREQEQFIKNRLLQEEQARNEMLSRLEALDQTLRATSMRAEKLEQDQAEQARTQARIAQMREALRFGPKLSKAQKRWPYGPIEAFLRQLFFRSDKLAKGESTEF